MLHFPVLAHWPHVVGVLGGLVVLPSWSPELGIPEVSIVCVVYSLQFQLSFDCWHLSDWSSGGLAMTLVDKQLCRADPMGWVLLLQGSGAFTVYPLGVSFVGLTGW